MRMGAASGAAMALACALLPGTAQAQSPLEQQVLAALNAARSNPAAYADALHTYRGYFHAKVVSLPGSTEDLETSEGVAAVDETIAFLAQQAPLAPLGEAPILDGSAADHTADQSRSGATGHDGSDGSSPGDRVRRRGGGEYVAEVIAYGSVDAVDVIRQLIVDDGVADRGHRGVIYAPELRYAGVSCGPHPEFHTMCVIDLAVTADGRFGREIHMASRMGPHTTAAN